MEKLSIVVPCYNEESSLVFLYDEINKISLKMSYINFEILFVNDGSKDDTLKIIKELSNKDNRVRYISFSRNFGKEAAIYAGLEHALGDYITLMDADLQDPPYLLVEMLDTIKNEGFDCVGTRRVNRKGEPKIRSFFARRFYKFINRISDVEIVDGARDYKLMTRQVVDEIVSIKEYNRFSKGIFSFVGFETKWIEYENVDRVAGETKWSFFKLVKYAIDGTIAFSTTPLIISSIMGMVLCLIAFVYMLFIITKTLIYGDPVSGWPSTMVTILFVGGVQLFCMGILGQYLAKNYSETKKRPIYITKESSDDKKDI